MKIGVIPFAKLRAELGLVEEFPNIPENMISWDIGRETGGREWSVIDISDEGDHYQIQFSRDIIRDGEPVENIVFFEGQYVPGDEVMTFFSDENIDLDASYASFKEGIQNHSQPVH